MTTRRGHDLFAIALLILLPTLFFAKILFGPDDLYLRDLARFHYPMKRILREVVLGGEFPYWNRYQAAGQPLAANPQHEVFYPPNWLIFLPDYDLGFRLQIVFHIYVAAIGMYALLRSMQRSPIASTFGAISFSMGGLYLSLVNLLPFLYSAAWIPLTCLFTRKFLISRRWIDFALASMFLGIQLLVGEPTTIVQTGFLLGVYALYRGWSSERRLAAALANVARIATICLAAIALAAVQVIPTLDHFRGSVRAQSLIFELVSAWSMPVPKLGELVFPNLLGHASISGMMWYWGARLYPGTSTPYLLSIYCGFAVVALAFAGVVTRIRGTRMFVVVFAISVILALGAHTPLLRLLYDAGIATSIRYPEKFVLMGVFSMIVFAGHALDAILEGNRRLRHVAAGFAVAMGIVAGAISLLGFTHYSVDGFLRAWDLPLNAGTQLMIARAWRDWTIAALRPAALLALLLTVYTRRRAIWVAAALLFICADLGGVVDELTPRMPRWFFSEVPPLAKVLPGDRTKFRIYHDAEWDYRAGPVSTWIARNGLFPPINVGFGIASVMERDFDKSNLIPTTEFLRAVADIRNSGRPNWWLPLMAMSNAWYRTVYNNYEEEIRRTGGDLSKLAPLAFERVNDQPRYYFADQIVQIADRSDFVRKMIRQRFTPNVAFIMQHPFVPAPGIVHGFSETANRASIDVESAARALLVMSVTPHKYWHITIDGAPIEPMITNIGYQGVVVPPGRHRVEMRYRNMLVPIGFAISTATAVALLLIALIRRPRARIVESHALSLPDEADPARGRAAQRVPGIDRNFEEEKKRAHGDMKKACRSGFSKASTARVTTSPIRSRISSGQRCDAQRARIGE